MGILAVVSGGRFSFDMSFPYVGSLIYLSVFGTIIAFGCYLKLIGKQVIIAEIKKRQAAQNEFQEI
jgi:drug/metabolite transporter (DMT)-like permease